MWVFNYRIITLANYHITNMELSQIIPHIEALIFASEKPLTNMDLVELLNNAMGFIEDRATMDQVDVAVQGIREKYSAEFYAFELKQSGGGWQFLTKKEYHKTIAQLNGDKFLKRLSSAALETLAIIAYKQPITKSEIESIRGVNCDYAVQKLLEKDLVIIAGRNEDAVGKPLIYTTSKSFMDYFGINSTADLPKINEVLMDELVQATIVNSTAQRDSEMDDMDETTGSTVMAVTEDGEIVENILELTNDDLEAAVDEVINELVIIETTEEMEIEHKAAIADTNEEIIEVKEELTDDQEEALIAPEVKDENPGYKQVKDEEEQAES